MKDGAQVILKTASRYGRTSRPAFDPIACRQRNIIERAFCRLKDWRAIATRYDKTAHNFLAGIRLAAAITWWIS